MKIERFLNSIAEEMAVYPRNSLLYAIIGVILIVISTPLLIFVWLKEFMK